MELKTQHADRRLYYALEAFAVIIFLALLFLLFRELIILSPSFLSGSLIMIGGCLMTIIVAYLGADFTSGLVHFLGDTIGDETTPFVGKNFIFPFREHHVDQTAITRHNFFIANGANSIVSLPLSIVLFFWLPNITSSIHYFTAVFVTFFLLFIFLTNQIHKWAHLPEEKIPKFIKQLQTAGLIISPKRHHRHHTPPFDSHFCITTGWLNPLLERTRLFTHLKRLLSRYVV